MLEVSQPLHLEIIFKVARIDNTTAEVLIEVRQDSYAYIGVAIELMSQFEIIQHSHDEELIES